MNFLYWGCVSSSLVELEWDEHPAGSMEFLATHKHGTGMVSFFLTLSIER